MPDWRGAVQAQLPGQDAEVIEELAQHLELRYQELRTAGAAAAAAEAELLAELRGTLPAQLRRRRVDRQRGPEAAAPAPAWTGLGRDLRHAARLLGRQPGFALAAVLSLALGIGANAAVFQLLDAVVLRTLPVAAPRRLAQINLLRRSRTGDVSGGPGVALTYALWQRLKAGQKGFSGLGAWYEDRVEAGEGAGARPVRALLVSGEFFQTLGVAAARGRLIGPEDDPAGCQGFVAEGVVLSHAFWESRYGGEPVVGKMLAIEGHALPIVGISAAGFTGLNVGRSFEVALPLCAEPMVDGEPALLTDAQGWWLSAIGRLRPDWTMERASAQLAAISPAMFAATVPPMYGAEDRVIYRSDKLAAAPAATGVSGLRLQYEEPLWLLLALAGLVLLIACANLANLMLARVGARSREMAVRLALGAPARRLVRQLLIESLLLAGAGAVLGAGVGWAGSRALAALLSAPGEPVFLSLTPDWRLLALLAGLAGAACVLFGLAPALRAGRTAPAEALKTGGRGAAAGGRSWLRRGLMAAQVALALVLLISALLFAGTLRRLAAVAPGFQAQHVLDGYADLSQVPVARLQLTAKQLLHALQSLPGVESAATASNIPLSGQGWNENVAIGGEKGRPVVDFNAVSPRYFSTLGVPLLAGRDFTGDDTAAALRVAIVSAAFARTFLGGANPVGRAFQIAGDRDMLGPVYTIVGEVGDTKYMTLREPFVPIIYEAAAQSTNPGPTYGYFLRSREPLAGVIAEANRAAANINPAISLGLQSFQQDIGAGLAGERLTAELAACFAGLALVLAVIGVYGVVSYLVVQRRKEVGIRLAIGATPAGVTRMFLTDAWRLLAPGLVLGAALAWAAGRAERSLLYGVTAGDPRLWTAAIVLLAGAGTLAALIPARRAAGLDPRATLSEE